MNELIDEKNPDKEKKDTSIKIKYCDCSFCSQFYFARNKKYRKNIGKQNKIIKIYESNNDNINNLKNNNIDNINNNQTPNETKKFTLRDLDNITLLKSLNCDNDEISKNTNLSNSVINYVMNMLYP